MLISLIGGVAGLAFGALVGFGKFALLWKKILDEKIALTMGVVYRRMGSSYVINFAALLLVFLLRNVMPCDFVWPLLGVALGLSLSARFAPMHDVMKLVKDDKSVNYADKEIEERNE